MIGHENPCLRVPYKRRRTTARLFSLAESRTQAAFGQDYGDEGRSGRVSKLIVVIYQFNNFRLQNDHLRHGNLNDHILGTGPE
jgi:hypothetical protein